MPYRVEPFRAGEYYHLYNRGSNYQDTFFERDNYRHFILLQMNIVLDQFSSPSDYRAFVEMDQVNQPQTIKYLVLE